MNQPNEVLQNETESISFLDPIKEFSDCVNKSSKEHLRIDLNPEFLKKLTVEIGIKEKKNYDSIVIRNVTEWKSTGEIIVIFSFQNVANSILISHTY